MRCSRIFDEGGRECGVRAECFPHRYKGENKKKHMWPEWLSQAQDKHLTLVVQGCLFISPLCIRALNGPQRSSSNRCCSHEVSGICLATVTLSSRAFGQYLGTASLALKLCGACFAGCPCLSVRGQQRVIHILIVSQSPSQGVRGQQRVIVHTSS